MSIDKLQNQIRKMKSPSAVFFPFDKAQIPPCFLKEAADEPYAYCLYAKSLLVALKDSIPMVRFGFASFALCGIAGIDVLGQLLKFASEQGFYVLLDMPEPLSAGEAELAADALFSEDGKWIFDGLLLSGYIGSDAVKPFVEKIKANDKDLFFTVRSGNKSAPELQDLVTGSRLVYTVAADMTKRLGEEFLGRCGFSRIAGMGPATSAEILHALRSKYPEMFLLIDGYDYSGANAKNCSYAFNKLGHGAIACAGSSITAAWKEENAGMEDAVVLAVQAAERMKKNLNRYVSIL